MLLVTLFNEDGNHAFDICAVVALILIGGLMAGCTMGIISLDPLLLRLKELEGSAAEQRWARAVRPVHSAHHHLLVTLLLCNAGANEALPIFLDRLVSPTNAILLSVTCVLIFGEILPSAVMPGPGPHMARTHTVHLPLGALLSPCTVCGTGLARTSCASPPLSPPPCACS